MLWEKLEQGGEKTYKHPPAGGACPVCEASMSSHCPIVV